MFESLPYRFGKSIVTPDRMYVPSWGLERAFDDSQGITWTYYRDELYAGGKPLLHPTLYNLYNFPKQGLDGRLWTEDRIFTFWWCGKDMDFGRDEITRWTADIARKFSSHDFIVPETTHTRICDPGNIDITDYTYAFLADIDGKTMVVKCDYETFIKGAFDLHDCTKLRFFRLSTRNDPVFTRPPFIPLEKPEKSQYQRSCEYWTGRIGNMDVAEWHILSYGE